jgi:cell division transport system ATP-binding protein
MIQFSHVYKTYPNGGEKAVHALANVDLQIEKGEFVFLTGPSGAGKTTLFKMISAFEKPTSGLVKVAGYDLGQISVSQVPLFRRRIGVVFQDFKLLRDRTVAENIALPLTVKREKAAFIKKRVNEVLAQVELEARQNHFPEQLSGGEQQRVAIARALIHKPGVLIADEPTGNLDRRLAADVMELFERVNAQGTTVFVATHDLSLLSQKPMRRHLHIEAGQIQCL